MLDIAGLPGSALTLAVGGVLTGVVSAFAGAAVLNTRDGRRGFALFHGIVEMIALMTASASVLLRLSDALPAGQILNAVALTISASSAYRLMRR